MALLAVFPQVTRALSKKEMDQTKAAYGSDLENLMAQVTTGARTIAMIVMSCPNVMYCDYYS